MGFKEDLRNSLIAQIGPSGRYANRKQMADGLELDPSLLNRFLDGKRGITADTIDKILARSGAKVLFPGEAPRPEQETVRPVCFVQPEVSGSTYPWGTGPAPEDYLAVPLAAEPVAAGQGIIPQDDIQGWVLVWRHEEAIRFKSNLVAVMIGKNERSMIPTLYPGDIVLVDRSDKDPAPAGKIMLVVEPGGAGEAGGAMIKRVATKRVDGDVELVFYSDNAKEFAPYTYKLKRDYDGDITRAIGGHVIWSWANMTKR